MYIGYVNIFSSAGSFFFFFWFTSVFGTLIFKFRSGTYTAFTLIIECTYIMKLSLFICIVFCN